MLRITLLASLLLSFGCERRNGAYCDTTTPCGAGLVCDQVAHECTDQSLDMSGQVPDLMPEGDLLGADMVLTCNPACIGTTPLCVAGACMACGTATDPEMECATRDNTAPHCQTMGTNVGACVQCRGTGDCSDPAKRICDDTTHTCRGCTSDNECPSFVCDLTPGSANVGRCLAQSSVAYVGVSPNCNDANDAKTPAMAVCKPSVALDKVKNPPIGYTPTVIRFATGTYDIEDIKADGLTVTLVGETGATFKPKGNNNPALEVKGATADVTVRNLRFTAGAGANGSGIRCEGATVGKLTVLGSLVYSNNVWGIDGNTCIEVTIDQIWIGELSNPVGIGNKGGGIQVGNSYRIRNSVIHGNGTTIGAVNTPGVQINSPNTVLVREFVSNTVLLNKTPSLSAGVSCPATNAPMLVSSILYSDLSVAVVMETNCPTSFVATSDAVSGGQPNNVNLSAQQPGFVSATDFRLTAGSPCKDKGPTLGGTTPAYDYDGKPRPDKTTLKADIGAFELQ